MDLQFYSEWIMTQRYWGTDNRESRETQEKYKKQWHANIQ